MALYNMVRPMKLSEVKGQDNLKIQLNGMFQSGNIPNALLFIGPRGTGKTTVARIVAKQLNCEHGGVEPCNECNTCKSIISGTSLDVIELDAASNNKVEDMHQILEKVQYAPIGKKKVVILDEVHMFSDAAWNAMLKTLEEPPKDVLFILCTTEEGKVPATIVSRCRKFFFEKINLGTVSTALAEICDKYNKAYEEDALKIIARASDGCMRDALSILESFFDIDGISVENVTSSLGLSDEDVIFDILEGIEDGDLKKALSSLRSATNKGKSLQALVKNIMGAVTDAMFVLQGASSEEFINTSVYKERLAKYSHRTTMNKCLELTKSFSDVYSNVTKSKDNEFMVEAAILRTIQSESELEALKKDVATLKNRLIEIEKNGVSVIKNDEQQLVHIENIETDVVIEEDAKGPIQELVNNDVSLEHQDTTSEDDYYTNMAANGFSAYEDEMPSSFDFVKCTAKTTATSSKVVQMPLKQVEMQESINKDTPAQDTNDVSAILPEGTEVAETISLFGGNTPLANNKEDIEQKVEPEPVNPLRPLNDDMPPMRFGLAMSGFLRQ